MLHDLAHEDAAKGSLVELLQVLDEVRLFDVEAIAAGVGDHVGVGVDASSVDSCFPQQPEQLTAPTADVEHGRALAEVFDVRALAFANRIDAPTHPALEGEVIGHRRRGGLGRDGGRSLRCTGRSSPLEPR